MRRGAEAGRGVLRRERARPRGCRVATRRSTRWSTRAACCWCRHVADGDERAAVRAAGFQSGDPCGDRQPGRYARRRPGDVQGRGRLFGVPDDLWADFGVFLSLVGVAPERQDPAYRDHGSYCFPTKMWAAASRSISAASPPEPTRTPWSVPETPTTLSGSGADAAQGRHQHLVLLQLLGDAADPHRGLVARPAGHLGERDHAVHELVGLAGLTQLVEAGDRVAVRRLGGVAEQLDEAALDGLGHHVLPAAGLGVDELPVEADDVGEQPFGEAVLAHHPGRQPHALLGELEVTVALDGHQAVALHPGDGLGDGRAALVQPLGDPGTQRDDAFLDELVDRPEVHLGGVDQVAHLPIVTRSWPTAWRWQSGGVPAVMWFRRDLRLSDNPALLDAAA